ncbi:MAG: hydroxymethylbilane synthase [Bacteroidota bacterium]
MNRIIKIGTRSNKLSLWQANTVAQQLNHFEHETEIVKMETLGDLNLGTPRYELTETDIFTQNIDSALLNEEIDIAVHDLKDVPANLPEGIVQAAVLSRGDYNDVLVLKDNEDFFTQKEATIATESLRCKSQWLYRYPNHKVVGISGSIEEQLQKLEENDWNGIIFAKSDLKRLGLLPKNHLKLEWILPAPAQGTVVITARENDNDILAICKELNDKETEICTGIERNFLRTLDTDFSSPVGALATINKKDELKFKGAIFSVDGIDKTEFSKEVPVNHTTDLGEFAAKFLLERGGKKLMRKVINIDKEILVYSTKALSLTQKNEFNSNIGVEMSDFIKIRFNRLKPVIIKDPLKNVVFTNQNAVESVLNNFSSAELDFTNIYCIGRRTKRLIEKNIGKVAHYENSMEKLIEYLEGNFENKEINLFCAEEDDLDLKNIEVNKIESYRTLQSSVKVDDKFKGILFYSPAGIASYLTKNKADSKIAFCLGASTAKEAGKYFKNVVPAKLPTVESLIKSANNFF